MKPRFIALAAVLFLLLIGLLVWKLFPGEKPPPAAISPRLAPTASLAPIAVIEAPKLPPTTLKPTDIFAEATEKLRKVLAQVPVNPGDMPSSTPPSERMAASQKTSQFANDLAALISSLAKQDLPGTLAWVQNLPDDIPSGIRHSIMRDVMATWVETDPVSAENFALNYIPNSHMLAIEVTDIWAQQDSPAALAWAESLPPGPAREDTIAVSLGRMALVDGQTAWDHAVSFVQANQTFSGFSGIISSWSRTDPAAAASALATLPEDASSVPVSNMVSGLMTQWMTQDRTTAAQWVANLPAGSLHDAAVVSLNQFQQAYNQVKSSGGGKIFGTGQNVYAVPNTTQIGATPVDIPLFSDGYGNVHSRLVMPPDLSIPPLPEGATSGTGQ